MSDVGPVDVPKTKCDCPHCREKDPKPFGIILHCPQCGRQHVDHLELDGTDWSKRLHRTHRCVDGPCLCPAPKPELLASTLASAVRHHTHTLECSSNWKGCGFEWQPALVYTIGVRSLT